MTTTHASIEEPTDVTDVPGPAVETADELADELLIEEISIDGMCGVY